MTMTSFQIQYMPPNAKGQAQISVQSASRHVCVCLRYMSVYILVSVNMQKP